MLMVVLVVVPGVVLAEPAAPPCSAPAFRSFDFWAGEWRVEDATGTHVGDNTITIEESGCVLVEHWRGTRGATGQSMNFFDPLRGKWRQIWISPGSQIELAGEQVGDYLVLEGTITYLGSGEHYPFRGSWRALPDGRVRQFFEEARTEGTWKTWFEGFYSRRTASLDKPG
jgi:hypothetical protein